MHKLVQDMIRLSLKEDEEIKWITSIGRMLRGEEFIKLCNTSHDFSRVREFVVENLVRYGVKHDKCILELSWLIVDFWRDSIPGDLPDFRSETFANLSSAQGRVLGRGSFSTQLAESYYLQDVFIGEMQNRDFTRFHLDRELLSGSKTAKFLGPEAQENWVTMRDEYKNGELFKFVQNGYKIQDDFWRHQLHLESLAVVSHFAFFGITTYLGVNEMEYVGNLEMLFFHVLDIILYHGFTHIDNASSCMKLLLCISC